MEGSAHLAAGKELADALAEDVLADVTFGDLRVQLDSWLSMARHLQGDHEKGRRLVDGADQRARALGGPVGIVTALTFAVCSRVLTCEVADAQRLAEELIGQTDRLQLADFAYHGRVVRAWAAALGGSPKSEVLAMLNDVPSALGAGIRPWHPFWLVLTAEACQRIGRQEEARRLVDDALSEIDAMGSSFSVAEVLRLRGELLVAVEPHRQAEALADLDEAVRRAVAQGAVVYRDRASASAARQEHSDRAQQAPR